MNYRIFHNSANGWGHMYEIPLLMRAEKLGILAQSEGYILCLSKKTPHNRWLANVINNEYAPIYFVDERQVQKLRHIQEHRNSHSQWIGYIHPELSNMPDQDLAACNEYLSTDNSLLKGSAKLFLNFNQTFFGLVQLEAQKNGHDLYRKMRSYLYTRGEMEKYYQIDSRRKFAVINLRDTSFNPTNRDCITSEYSESIKHLVDRGYQVVRIGYGRKVGYSHQDFIDLHDRWSSNYELPLVYHADLMISNETGPLCFRGRLGLSQLLIDLSRANLETVLRYHAGLLHQTFVVRDVGDKPLKSNQLLQAVTQYIKHIEEELEIRDITYDGYEDCSNSATFDHFASGIKEIKCHYKV